MILNGTVLVYVLAAIIAVSAVTIVMLLIRGRNIDSKEYLKYIAVFIIANFLIGGIYLWETVNSAYFEAEGYGAFFRVIDIALYVVQSFSWTSFIILFTGMEKSRLYRLAVPFHGVMLVICVFTYGFMLDSNYVVSGNGAVVCELIIAVGMSAYQICAGVMGVRSGSGEGIKVYVGFVTAMIILSGWWNAASTLYTIVSGRYFESSFDYTSAFLALIAVATIMYIYRTDFSVLFLSNDTEIVSKDKKTMLEEIAEKYGLTDREREVFYLAYEGLSNPEIAEQLFISKYTVKHHMHSIFEKMNVSGRVDMLVKVSEEE